MPGRVIILGKGTARVRYGGRVTAKRTTVSKARKQLRLLNAIKHGFKPRRKKR